LFNSRVLQSLSDKVLRVGTNYNQSFGLVFRKLSLVYLQYDKVSHVVGLYICKYIMNARCLVKYTHCEMIR